MREAGWGWAVLEQAGGAETFIANGHGKFLTFMSRSSCLKGTEIEQGAKGVWERSCKLGRIQLEEPRLFLIASGNSPAERHG